MPTLKRILLSVLYQVSHAAVLYVGVSLLLDICFEIGLPAGNRVLWYIIGTAALVVMAYSWLALRKLPAGRKGGSGRTPFTRRGAVDKPVWRHLPRQKTLLADTNVLMCPDDCIRNWFGYLLNNAEQNGWRFVVPGAVYEEILHHAKHGNENKAKDARLARNRIELLQEKLGARMEIAGLQRQSPKDPDSRYADPQIIDYMQAHANTILLTFDNDLKIRCKQLMRAKQPGNRVFSEEDFYAENEK